MTWLLRIAVPVVLAAAVWLPQAGPRVEAGAGLSVPLRSGLNNVAYQGETLPVDRALAGVAEAVTAVWHWEAESASWSSYFPAVPSIATLAVLERGEAYWLRAVEAVVWEQPNEIIFATALVEVTAVGGAKRVLRAELADTPARRSRGLMFRPSLSDGAGMLFLFPADTRGGFWMMDTVAPLSIAFIDAGGVICEIQDMEPLTTTVHVPAAAYRWALEVSQGWFEENGVEVGALVRLTGQ